MMLMLWDKGTPASHIELQLWKAPSTKSVHQMPDMLEKVKWSTTVSRNDVDHDEVLIRALEKMQAKEEFVFVGKESSLLTQQLTFRGPR